VATANGVVVAGVDSSTTATKVEVRELESGRVVGRGSAPHPRTHPPRSEQDPSAWWGAFESAWQQAGAPDVAAISVAGQQHGMVALDEQRAVIRPAKLWNDTESAPDAAWLVAQLAGGSAAWADACGVVPVASITITKLSWLHRSEPEAWQRLAHVLLPHDWLTFQLTGRLATDRGDASGTGYWSAATGTYCFDLLALVDGDRDWTGVVPPVLGPGDVAGEWRGAQVGPGTGDNMAGALGVGLRPSDVAVSIGTSGTVYAVSNTPTADPSGAVAGFADASGRHLPLVCTLNATKVTDAVAGLLGIDHGGLDELALAAPPGAGGLSLLPYLDGERTPNRPAATGVLAGLRSDVTREQLARAAVEGVVCGLLDGLDALSAFAPVGGRLLLVGGGAHSQAYRQVVADLSGRTVLVPRGDQPVAAGACVQAAAVATGAEVADIADRWRLGEGDEVEPGPGASAAADVRAAYAALRDATAPG
jgi:xylulokinase